MAFRAFSLLQVQSPSRPQPVIGSWVGAGLSLPCAQPVEITLGGAAAGSGVTDAQALFRPGDEVVLINPDGTGYEKAYISSMANAAQNKVVLGHQHLADRPVTTQTHVSGIFGVGAFILLHAEVNNLAVQLADGAGSDYLYLGTAWNMTSTYLSFVKLAKVGAGSQPYLWSATETSAGNPFSTSELWILGGTGNSLDGYTPSYAIA